jgi:hypothetical protein
VVENVKRNKKTKDPPKCQEKNIMYMIASMQASKPLRKKKKEEKT